MIPATIETYGAPVGGFTDKQTVADPTSEWAAEDGNKLLRDVAQLTRTAPRILYKFATVAVTPGTSLSVRSMWGDTLSYAPTTNVRASAGRYTLTWPAEFADELSNDETLSFYTARGWVESLTDRGHVQCTVSGAVVEVIITDLANTPSDLTAGTTIVIEIT